MSEDLKKQPATMDSARPKTVLFMWDQENPEPWYKNMVAELGDIDFRIFPEVGDPSQIEYVMTWMPPIGELRKLPNLKAIFSIGAGVTHILRDETVPAQVPIYRLVDPVLNRDMTCHAVHWVLHFHRDYAVYAEQQRSGTWQRHKLRSNASCRVGVMGMGTVGTVVASTLHQLGFDVAGWSQSRKELAGVESFAGSDEFKAFLNHTDILICLLPPTPQTCNLLDAARLSQLPTGSFIINMSRGDIIVDDDLLAAMKSGHIRGAALDVFRTEPLAPSDAYWTQPGVYITPHVAASTTPEYGARRIASNIRLLEQGTRPEGELDRARGY